MWEQFLKYYSCVFVNSQKYFCLISIRKNMLCYLVVYNLVVRIKHVNKCRALKIMPHIENAQRF